MSFFVSFIFSFSLENSFYCALHIDSFFFIFSSSFTLKQIQIQTKLFSSSKYVWWSYRSVCIRWVFHASLPAVIFFQIYHARNIRLLIFNNEIGVSWYERAKKKFVGIYILKKKTLQIDLISTPLIHTHYTCQSNWIARAEKKLEYLNTKFNFQFAIFFFCIRIGTWDSIFCWSESNVWVFVVNHILLIKSLLIDTDIPCWIYEKNVIGRRKKNCKRICVCVCVCQRRTS